MAAGGVVTTVGVFQKVVQVLIRLYPILRLIYSQIVRDIEARRKDGTPGFEALRAVRNGATEGIVNIQEADKKAAKLEVPPPAVLTAFVTNLFASREA